jgi:hypothetical protein
MKKYLILSGILLLIACFFLVGKTSIFSKDQAIQVLYTEDTNEFSIRSTVENFPFQLDFEQKNDTLFYLRKYRDFNGDLLGTAYIPYWPREKNFFTDKRNTQAYPPVVPGQMDDWKVLLFHSNKGFRMTRLNMGNKSLRQSFVFDRKFKLVSFSLHVNHKHYFWSAE